MILRRLSLHVGDLRKSPDFWPCLALLLWVLCLTLPFLNHAFHIDEPLFLRVARQIQNNPLNPYGFQYLWHEAYEPMQQIATYPPFFPYVLALASWGRTFPSEGSIHLALIPFAILAVLDRKSVV